MTGKYISGTWSGNGMKDIFHGLPLFRRRLECHRVRPSRCIFLLTIMDMTHQIRGHSFFVHPSLELLCRSSASGQAILLEFSKLSPIFSLNLFAMNIKESPEYTDRFPLSQFSPSSGSWDLFFWQVQNGKQICLFCFSVTVFSVGVHVLKLALIKYKQRNVRK